MGFKVLDENDRSLGKVSFKGIEPENGTYTCTLNLSETSGRKLERLKNIKLYVVDYAYNENYYSASLSGELSDENPVDLPVLPELEPYRFDPSPVVDLSEKDSAKKDGASLLERLIEKLKTYA